jgi:phospholipid N-methyltransferase
LIKALVKPIPKDALYLIELGSGEGCVTRAIESHVTDDCTILSFEINQKLLKMNKSSRKNTKLINDNAMNIETHLGKDKMNVKCIVSSLPFASIGKNDTHAILSVIANNLHPEGKFIQYQYSLLSKNDLKKHFSQVKIKFIPLNIPPAFVYICKK